MKSSHNTYVFFVVVYGKMIPPFVTQINSLTYNNQGLIVREKSFLVPNPLNN